MQPWLHAQRTVPAADVVVAAAVAAAAVWVVGGVAAACYGGARVGGGLQPFLLGAVVGEVECGGADVLGGVVGLGVGGFWRAAQSLPQSPMEGGCGWGLAR